MSPVAAMGLPAHLVIWTLAGEAELREREEEMMRNRAKDDLAIGPSENRMRITSVDQLRSFLKAGK